MILDSSGVIWSSETAGTGFPPFRLIVRDNNNCVLFDVMNKKIWATETKGGNRSGTSELVIQNDRNLVLYDGAGKYIWGSDTAIEGADR